MSYEPSRQRAVDCARAIASGCRTVAAMRERQPNGSEIQIRTALNYLRTHKYIRSTQGGRGKQRAVYELCMPLAEIEEALIPKSVAPIQFGALEMAMGLPAPVAALLATHPPARYVTQMGVGES